GGRGELDGECHVPGRTDLDVLDHVEADDVAAELGLLNGAQRLTNGGLGKHVHSLRWKADLAGSADRKVCESRSAGYGSAFRHPSGLVSRSGPPVSRDAQAATVSLPTVRRAR